MLIGWVVRFRVQKPNPLRPLAPNPTLSSGRPTPHEPPHNPSPFPFDPHSPSILLARRHGLHPRSHVSEVRGVDPCRRRGGPPPVFASSLCHCCCSLSPSVHSSAAAVRSAEKMREGGDKGKEQPDPAPSLFPSCMRPGEPDGEGRRHGQRRRYHYTGTSTSRDQIWCGTCGIMHRHVILAMIYAGDLAINRGIWTTNDVIFTREKRPNCSNQ